MNGHYVRLEPLTVEHAHDLYTASTDPDIWQRRGETQPRSAAEMRSRISSLEGSIARLAWAQIDKATNTVAGTTSYYNIDQANRALVIGHTWLGRPWHRTGINTDAKLLLLQRAFEELHAIRVVWYTHINNLRSQRAIERLGAVKEGIHRKHKLFPDGIFHDVVVYSMVDTEWPTAKQQLRNRQQQFTQSIPGTVGLTH